MDNPGKMPRFHKLVPGAKLEGDWHHGTIPENVEVGENTVLDSSFCFYHYYSKQPVGARLGSDITLWRTSFACEWGGVIEIGDQCFIANASLVIAEHLSIGSRCFIAGGVTIADTDFHPLDPAQRLIDSIATSPVGERENRPHIDTAPVKIGDDVWIGFNATILKGVEVGDGAVIEPGSLVLKSVPAGARVAGNPAKIVEGGA